MINKECFYCWKQFYQKHPDKFIKDYFGIKLYPFQTAYLKAFSKLNTKRDRIR